MFQRCAAALSPLLLAVSVCTAHAQAPTCEPAKVAQKYPTYAGKVVKIAVSPDQPPFAFSDPKNPERMTGLEVEMIEAVMACAGLKFDYVKGAWAGLLPALFSGSADVMIGNVNYRPDRAERANFIIYARAGQSIQVQRGNPKKISNLMDLCGTTGSGTMGGSSVIQVERQNKICVDQGKPGITFLPATDGTSSSRQLANARVDFVMDDAASGAARAMKEPEIEIAYTVTTDILSGMVVTKGNAAMRQVIADGLKVQEANGILPPLAKKYGFPTELLVPIQTPP